MSTGEMEEMRETLGNRVHGVNGEVTLCKIVDRASGLLAVEVFIR